MLVSPNSMARSSLEEMLDSLRRRDENEKPKDMPPALPARPKLTSRARLPSSKRQLPTSFEAGETNEADMLTTVNKGEQSLKGYRGHSSFGSKKAKAKEPRESPYDMVTEKKECEERLEKEGGAKLANSQPVSPPRFRETEWDDNIGYFIKTVRANIQYFICHFDFIFLICCDNFF